MAIVQLERSVYGYERGYALRVYELGEVVSTGAGPLPLIAQSLREPDLLFSYRGELFFRVHFWFAPAPLGLC